VNRGSRPEDAQATQKISREQLEEALKRTKSGTRRATRSDPALPAPEEVDFLGPRDDTAPPLFHIDPSSLSPVPAAAATAATAEPTTAATAEPEASVERVASADPVVSVESVAFVEAADDLLGPERSAESARPARDVALRVAPRTAFVAGLGVVMLVMLAALVGFFAGRPHP
jgi:hypothetical protein